MSSCNEGSTLVLTARDRRMITLLTRFRLLSRDQIMTLAPFHSLTRVNTRLAALVRARVLSRKQIAVLPGHGSAQALYSLGPRSADFTQCDAMEIRRQVRQAARWEWSSVEHLLTCNELLIAFGRACRTKENTSLIAFRTEPELRETMTQASLCPDGWLAWRSGDRAFNGFIEVDLHHEGLTQCRSKVLAYQAYASSGLHKELFEFASFRVFVVAKSRRRLDSLRRICGFAEGLFFFSDLQAAVRNPLGGVWLRADGDAVLGPEEA